MKIEKASNPMFTIYANPNKKGDMENVKKVAEMFYEYGFDGAEMDDCEDGYVVICTTPNYGGRKENIELYKMFKKTVEGK